MHAFTDLIGREIYQDEALPVIPWNAPHTDAAKAPGYPYENGWGYGFWNRRGPKEKLGSLCHPVDSRARLQVWSGPEWDGANIGMRADHFVFVDIDTVIAELAGLAERLYLDQLGPAPVRWRENSSRIALAYRVDTPLRVRPVKWSKSQQIEFLSSGRQTVIAGTHRSGVPLLWRGWPGQDIWSGDQHLLDIPYTELTLITLEQLDKVNDAVVAALEAKGFPVALRGASHKYSGDGSVGVGRRYKKGDRLAVAKDLNLIRAAGEKIPCDEETAADRDTQATKVLAMFYGASGGSSEGAEIAQTWINKWEPLLGPGEKIWQLVEDGIWDSFSDGTDGGSYELFDLSSKHGWDHSVDGDGGAAYRKWLDDRAAGPDDVAGVFERVDVPTEEEKPEKATDELRQAVLARFVFVAKLKVNAGGGWWDRSIQAPSSPESINTLYGQYRFPSGSGKWIQAATWLKKQPGKLAATDVGYTPGQAIQYRQEDKAIENSWRPGRLRSLFALTPPPPLTTLDQLDSLALLVRLVISEPFDHETFLDRLAAAYRHPGKGGFAIVLYSQQQGIGKDLLINVFGSPFGWGDNYQRTDTAALTDKWALPTCEVLAIDEVKADVKNWSRIKEATSPHALPARRQTKGGFIICRNPELIVITTNNLDALPLSLGDRRFWVNATPEDVKVSDPAFYKAVATTYLESEEGQARVAAFLWHRAESLSEQRLAELLGGPAPMTTAKRAMARHALQGIDAEIAEWAEDNSDVPAITSSRLSGHLRDKDKWTTRIGEPMKANGWLQWIDDKTGRPGCARLLHGRGVDRAWVNTAIVKSAVMPLAAIKELVQWEEVFQPFDQDEGKTW